MFLLEVLQPRKYETQFLNWHLYSINTELYEGLKQSFWSLFKLNK